MKQVREMNNAADKTFGAWIIMNPKNQHVATVQACWTKNGMCYVDVWNTSLSKTSNDNGPQQGKAGGYGYDKFSAAIRGMVIDGVKMTDHCGTDEVTEKLLKQYHAEGVKLADTGLLHASEEWQAFHKKWEAKVKKIGARFANMDTVEAFKTGTTGAGRENRSQPWMYSSLYYESNMDKLRLLGYDIINAL